MSDNHFTMRRFNAWLRVFRKSDAYEVVLYVGWLLVAAAALFCIPLYLLEKTISQ